MDSSAKNFQDFDPRFDWVHHPDSHVLIVHLLGFRSSQLKVQVTSTGKLRISGERKLGSGKWLRFHKEIEVPADADTDKISAKLEDGVLYVKQPKKANPQEQTKPKAETQPPAAAKPKADPPAVRENNASKNRQDRPKPQANGKKPTPPTKPQEPPKPKDEAGAPARTQKTTEKEKPATAGPQPVQEAAPKNSAEKQTDEKPKAHAKLKDALEDTRQKDEKEAGGSKMAEAEEKRKDEGGGHGTGKKEGGVADEARGKKAAGEMVDGGGRFRQEEVYKQVVDGMLKELRTKMVTLVLGVVVFVILYLNVTKKTNVEGEL